MEKYLLKLILVEHDNEIYEGVLMDYDDDRIYISTDGGYNITNFFHTVECEITLSEELKVPDMGDMNRKMKELQKKGRFIVTYDKILH